MKKNILRSLALLVMLLVMASPAAAAVQLDVNGRNYDTSGQADIQGNITMAPLNVLADTLGCTITQDGAKITLQENQDVLQMTTGSLAATLNGQEKAMPAAPLVKDGKTYVPIRFVYESFGATVNWQDAKQCITVSYAEMRDGMTADELITKSSQKMNEANRYKMTADAKIDIAASAPGSKESAETMNMKMDTHIEGWMQANPILMYMKQDAKVVPTAGSTPQAGPQSVQTEILFNDSGMYMTMPETGWVKMEMPGMNIQELMKQSNSQDPAAAMKQMKELGMSMSFANDQERNGQKYWVIDAAMGGDIFKSDYFKQMTKASGLEQTPDMQKLFDNMDADIKYSAWINQSTLYMDYMDMDSNMKIKMDIPTAEKTGPVNMDMAMKADYTMSDYGLPFSVPDVSKAVDFESVVNQAK
ncbi:MAG: copper amine oxidase N-terminal domain-containing protein [Syntrophomonas sp.]